MTIDQRIAKTAAAYLPPVLRPYQERGFAEYRRVVAAELRRVGRKHRVLMVGPTGCGKGTIITYMAVSGAKKGLRTLVVVPTREIALDLRRRIEACGMTCRIILGGEEEGDPDALVTIAGMTALFVRGVEVQADTVIFDEAHHATAGMMRAIAAKFPNAWHVGLTATPVRGDKTSLGNAYDEIIVIATIAELQAEGFLVPLDVIGPARFIGDAAAEDPLTAWESHAKGRATVGFTVRIDHAREQAERFTAAGYPAAFVCGDTPKEERDEILRRFAAGDILVIFNAFCLTEGWDCPSAEVCMLTRPCGSIGPYLQMVGRVLRPSPTTGKTRALLLDLCGNFNVHGLPDEDRVFALEGDPIRRAQAKMPLAQCELCGCVYRPAPNCPRCGHSKPVEAIVIDRQEIRKADRRESPEYRQQELDRLLRLARERGHKLGWVGHVYEAKYGEWPASIPRRRAS